MHTQFKQIQTDQNTLAYLSIKDILVTGGVGWGGDNPLTPPQ